MMKKQTDEGLGGSEETEEEAAASVDLPSTQSGLGCGLFVTFEGIDGCGKTTQARLLCEALAERAVPVRLTREPGGTELGQGIRRMLLDGSNDVDSRTEALLYAADRAYHVATVVRPALQTGTVVVQDRYIDSSLAYQGAGRSLQVSEIRALSEWATGGLGGLWPDLTFLFDLPPETALERLLLRSGESLQNLHSSSNSLHPLQHPQGTKISRDNKNPQDSNDTGSAKNTGNTKNSGDAKNAENTENSSKTQHTKSSHSLGVVPVLDRLEQAGLRFQTRVREGFLELARQHPERIHVIDATKTPTKIHETVLQIVLEALSSIEQQ